MRGTTSANLLIYGYLEVEVTRKSGRQRRVHRPVPWSCFRRGLIFERLGPFLKHLVELSDSIAQLAWITLVEESLPKSVYLRLIHSVHSLPLRRLASAFRLSLLHI